MAENEPRRYDGGNQSLVPIDGCPSLSEYMAVSQSTTTARFASALSTEGDPLDATNAACDTASGKLSAAPTLAFVFISHHWSEQVPAILKVLNKRLEGATLLGCTAESLAGIGREIEDQPGLSLWLAHAPAANLTAMHLEFERTAEGSFIAGWPDQLAGPWGPDAFLTLLADPFSFPTDVMLEQLNNDRAGVPVIGGMASGSQSPGGTRLILNDQVFNDGAVAVHCDGGLKLRTIVSQGCRPIGKTMVVTKAERNVLQQLGGKPAVLRLKETFDELPNREQVLVQRGLHLGRVVSEYRERFEQGDFLVRNVVGVDPNSGALGVGDYIRVGQTVQFHVRDAESADAELRQMLAEIKPSLEKRNVGALMFSCNGRGTNLFEQPHHDAGCVQQALGDVPLAGFFAAGEVGPIGGQNFVHGFTASIGVFEGSDAN